MSAAKSNSRPKSTVRVAPLSGVYAVRHIPSSRNLLAWSRDLNAALNRHRFELETGSHANKDLLHDWKTDGPDTFVFEILDQLEGERPTFDNNLENLETLENLWLERLKLAPEQRYVWLPRR